MKIVHVLADGREVDTVAGIVIRLDEKKAIARILKEREKERKNGGRTSESFAGRAYRNPA